MTRTMSCALAGALAGTLLCAGNAQAADEAVPKSIEACASLLRESERLACYDAAVAALMSGTESSGVSAENMFGATSATSQRNPGVRDVKREELKQISGTVTSLRRTDDGMIVVELDNGQVWRQQDSDVRMMLATGDTVTIVRASMGTFRIADKSGRFSRFKRVR
jgi:hypothetical protein